MTADLLLLASLILFFIRLIVFIPCIAGLSHIVLIGAVFLWVFNAYLLSQSELELSNKYNRNLAINSFLILISI